MQSNLSQAESPGGGAAAVSCLSNEDLAVLVKAGNRAALAALWEKNRGLLSLMFARLVKNPGSAARMNAAGVTFEDLQQEGYFAILKAAQGFDPAVGAKFTGFLKYAVMTVFFHAIGMRTRHQLGDPFMTAARLDEPLSNENADGETRGDQIPDPAAALAFDDAGEQILTRQLRAALDACLAEIDGRQATAIRAKYFEGRSLAQISRALCVSPERVRQLQECGLHTMRHSCGRLESFRREIIGTRSYRGTGVTAWKERGSVEEQVLELLEKNGLLLNGQAPPGGA